MSHHCARNKVNALASFLIANLGILLALGVLILGSAFFSCGETALFSLSPNERYRMKASKRRLDVVATALLEQTRPLLITIMLGSMTCNILVFVFGTLLLDNVGRRFGAVALMVLSPLPVLGVTFFGEILPKVLGNASARKAAPVLALPLATLVRLLWPVTSAIQRWVINPVKLLIGPRRADLDFSTDELRELLAMSEQQGAIDVSENELLQEIVGLTELHVRNVMVPRVDVVAFDIRQSREVLLDLIRRVHLQRIPVYDGQIDNLLGLVYAKTVLLAPPEKPLDLRAIMRPVHFVPENQRLDRLLAEFRHKKIQVAIAVDEYGGVAGLITLEDVVAEIVGDMPAAGEETDRPVQEAGKNAFLVSGDLPIGEWSDVFGATIKNTRASTVAGLMAVLLKKVPSTGDQVQMQHLRMSVESMRGRRVRQVRIELTEVAAHA